MELQHLKLYLIQVIYILNDLSIFYDLPDKVII